MSKIGSDRLSGRRAAPGGVRSFAKGAVATLAGASSLAFAALSPASAQSAPSNVDTVDDTILVTGEVREPQQLKLTAPIADTPKSIDVIPAEVLEATAATTLTEALRTIPGITLGSGEGGTGAGDRPFIRGIDSTNDLFVDGIRDSGVSSREVFNLEQVEVALGPGGAFTGRGATGGAINLVTKSPQAKSFYAGAAALGTDETQRFTIDLNQSLGGNAALRINAMRHEADVAGRDAVTVSRWGVAPSVAVGLGTSTRGTVSYYHLESDDIPDYGVPYFTTRAAVDPVYGPVTFREPLTGHDDTFWGLVDRDFRINESDIGTVRIEHDFGRMLTLSNVTRYGRSLNEQVVTNPDDSRGNVANGYVFRSSKNRGVEMTTIANVTDLRGMAATGGLKHSFDLGLEISREDNHNQGFVVAGPGLPALGTGTACSNPANLGAAGGYNCTTLDDPNPNDPWPGTVTRNAAFTDTFTDVLAAYAFDTVELSPQWQINLGLRFDDYSTKQKPVTATGPGAPLSRQDEFVNYQAGLVYKPVPAGTFYISTGSSTNPGGEGTGDASSLSAAIQILEPEENKSYEAGVKWKLFGDGLLATAAVFRTEKENARVANELGVQSNIGSQQIDGVELSVSGQITKDWFVFGGYTHLESEISDAGFQTIACSAANIALDLVPCRGVAVGTSVSVPSASTGKQFPNTPKDAVSLWTNYNVTSFLSIGGGASYMSERFGDTANRITVPSYWRYDAVASIEINDHVSLQLNGNNLSDERYVVQPYQTHMAQIAPGRSGLLTLNVKY